jgi:hypothetical protein
MHTPWTDLTTAQTDFAESVLGLYLTHRAPEVFALGTVQTLLPEVRLQVPPGALVVLLRGQLLGTDGWWGPGNHLMDPAGPLRAGSGGARVWSLPVGVQAAQELVLNALLTAEAAEAASAALFRMPMNEDACNHLHPLVVRSARRLLRDTPEATAQAIYAFVRAMPYRFGGWQERASDTLVRGVGMCTSKANLQVALMRAVGLSAAFVEIVMPMGVLGLLMPERWAPLMRSQARHYCAAVFLQDRWHAADASFSDESIRLFIEAEPALIPHSHARFGPGEPFHPVAMIQNQDPFDIEVFADLSTVMQKQSRFQAHHFEALNTRLDHAHGLHHLWMQKQTPVRWPAPTPAGVAE